MAVTEAEVKEVAYQVANLAISVAADKDLTGTQKEAEVCEFLAKLDDNIPVIGAISNELEAKVLEIGADEIKKVYAEDVVPFVKKCYERIKHIFKKA